MMIVCLIYKDEIIQCVKTKLTLNILTNRNNESIIGLIYPAASSEYSLILILDVRAIIFVCMTVLFMYVLYIISRET